MGRVGAALGEEVTAFLQTVREKSEKVSEQECYLCLSLWQLFRIPTFIVSVLINTRRGTGCGSSHISLWLSEVCFRMILSPL